MSSYTPGPWRIHRGDAAHHFNVSGQTNVVRNVRKESDARLIAAAPKLLELCQRALLEIESDVNDEEHGVYDPLARKLRATIKKAGAS